jgi:hypothetical protein
MFGMSFIDFLHSYKYKYKLSQENENTFFKEHEMKIMYFLMLASLFSGSLCGLPSQKATQNIVLLGTISFRHPIKTTVELPILYKGNEYEAKVEEKGDTKKAHFELYEQEKPTELYILITEYLTLPTQANIEHLSTSSDHPYRLFKLTLSNEHDPENNAHVLSLAKNELPEINEHWIMKEMDNSIKTASIPDNTIIFFMNPDLIQNLAPSIWQHESSIMRLPEIIFKEDITKEEVCDLAVKMKLALLDFKFFHKKTNSAFIPYANNRILSMPFSPRRSHV